MLFTQIFLAGSVNKNVLVFKNMAGSQGVDLLYVKQHTNLVYAHATIDLAGFSGIALRRIVLIAEALAQRYRSQEVRDLPDAEVQSLMQMDSIGLDKRGK